MSELAEELRNTSAALDRKLDPLLKKEAPKLIGLEKGLEFFGGQCQVHVANRLNLRQKAYQLIHDLYCQTGIAQKNGSDLWLSIYDALPDSVTFVAEDEEGRCAGTLTAIFDSPIGLPADELYKKEIDEIRNSGRPICEFVSLGIRDTAKNHTKIFASLIYCAYLHAWSKNKSTELIITVHSRYEKFYRRRIFFDKIGPERSYAKVNGAPTVLLRLSLKQVQRLRQSRRIFPFNIIEISDQRDLEVAKKIENRIQPMTVEEFYTFFIEKTDTWEKALSQQKEFIKNIYPADNINHNEIARLLAKDFSKKQHLSDDTRINTAKVVQR